MIRNVHIFLIFFLLFALSTRIWVSSWNDASRMATIQSLVEESTFIIDESIFIGTGDKYYYKGHFYSDKPPLLSLVSSPIYFVLFHVGITFSKHPRLAYYLITLLTIGVLSSCGLTIFRKILIQHFDVSTEWADLTTFLTGTGTLLWVFSSVFNNHIASAFLILMGYNYILRFKENQKFSYAFYSAIFLSLAGSIDFTCFLFLPFGFLPFIRKSWKAGLLYGLAGSIILSVYLFLNIHTSGSILPPPLNESLWIYEGSSFSINDLSGLAEHKNFNKLGEYIFHMIIGNRGLFTLSPILVFSVIGLLIRRDFSGKLRLRPELNIFLIACILYICLYLFRSVNYGGYAFGIRWYVSIMFIICIPIGFLDNWIRNGSKIKRILFGIVAIFSILISMLGYYAPFTPGIGFDTSSGELILHEGIIRPGLILTTSSTLWRFKFILLIVILFFLLSILFRRIKYIKVG